MEIKEDKDTICCSLTDIEMKERKMIIEKFKNLIIKREDIENGIAFSFNGNNSNLEEIINLIKLERQCCTFLNFELTIEKENKPIHLKISGPEGTKDFLSLELGL